MRRGQLFISALFVGAVWSNAFAATAHGSLSIAGCIPEDSKIEISGPSGSHTVDCKSPLLIEDIPIGKYTVTVRHPQMKPLRQKLEIKSGETVRKVLQKSCSRWARTHVAAQIRAFALLILAFAELPQLA